MSRLYVVRSNRAEVSFQDLVICKDWRRFCGFEVVQTLLGYLSLPHLQSFQAHLTPSTDVRPGETDFRIYQHLHKKVRGPSLEHEGRKLISALLDSRKTLAAVFVEQRTPTIWDIYLHIHEAVYVLSVDTDRLVLRDTTNTGGGPLGAMSQKWKGGVVADPVLMKPSVSLSRIPLALDRKAISKHFRRICAGVLVGGLGGSVVAALIGGFSISAMSGVLLF